MTDKVIDEALAAIKAQHEEITLAIQMAALAGAWNIADDIARRAKLPHACRNCGRSALGQHDPTHHPPSPYNSGGHAERAGFLRFELGTPPKRMPICGLCEHDVNTREAAAAKGWSSTWHTPIPYPPLQIGPTGITPDSTGKPDD